MKVSSRKKPSQEIADPKTAIYHFKIYLLNISPMIYRRFKVKGDVHIAELHHLIQIIMGWDNVHLHCFKIWGRTYGISQSGGMYFPDNPCKMLIGDFGFKVWDKFSYTYDFADHWQHEIRVEKIEEANSSYNHPSCITGKRACPPEDCGGPFSYHDAILDQSIWLSEILWTIFESVNAGKLPNLDFDDDRIPYWYRKFASERFDKAKINRAIKKLYQEKGDDRFWLDLQDYYDYLADE
jgi:hypothetical protein